MMYLVLPNSFRLARYLAPVALLAFVPLARPSADDYFPPPDAKQKLDEAFEYVQNTSQHGGLLVVRHGYLVYERYFGRGDREALPELASCGKAFTSVAVTSAPCSTRARNRATSPRAAASKNPGSCARQHAADKIRQAVFIS